MAGPNGLHAWGALVLENAISVVSRGRKPFCSVGVCVIWERERRQDETDETLRDEWKKQWIESWCKMWESIKKNCTKKEKWQTAVSTLESYENELPSRIVTEAVKPCRLWKPRPVLSVLVSSFYTFNPSHTSTQTFCQPSLELCLNTSGHCEGIGAWYKLEHICFQCTKAESDVTYKSWQRYITPTTGYSNFSNAVNFQVQKKKDRSFCSN